MIGTLEAWCMHRFVSPSLTQLASATALLGALLLVPTPAHAQDDVTLTMARERFKEGVGYFDKKDFAKARVAFLQAYALKKHPAVLLNLAQSELRSGHEADAAKHFAQYLRDYKDATDAERQGAETGLTAAKALVAEVAVEVDANGAEVYVDGDLEGQAPLPGPVFLAPGSHELNAKKDSKSAKTQVSAVAGQSSSVTLRLAAAGRPAPSGGAAPPPSGEGETPPPSEPAPEFDRENFFPWLSHKPAGIVGVGLFGVGLIGAGAFAVGSKSAYDAADSVAEGIKQEAVNVDMKPDSTGVCVNPSEWLAKAHAANPSVVPGRAEQYKKNCDKYTSNVNSGDTFKTLAFVSGGVAVAALAGTIIYYIVDTGPGSKSETARRNKPQRRVTLFPVHQPGFSGGILAGTF
jgi:hypothetical protein